MAQVSVDRRILDLDHLGRQTFCDRALERELLDLFEQQCERLMPIIASASPLPERLIAAHTLKGSARAVGAWRLAARVEKVEARLERGETAGASTLAGELAGDVRTVQAAIARRCATD